MKKKILIIDDDSVLEGALTDCFLNEGYDVESSSNATEAFRKIENRKPDVILTDLIMAKFDGFEVLRKIKESAHLKDILVIVISNSSEDKDVEKAISLGAKDFLSKSDLSLKEIIKRVKKVISKFDPDKK